MLTEPRSATVAGGVPAAVTVRSIMGGGALGVKVYFRPAATSL